MNVIGNWEKRANNIERSRLFFQRYRIVETDCESQGQCSNVFLTSCPSGKKKSDWHEDHFVLPTLDVWQRVGGKEHSMIESDK